MAKIVEMNSKRVVGLLGHSGGGKTSICEALLYSTKASDRIGSVDSGTSLMDFEPEEQKRNYSVSSAFFDIKYKDSQIFLVDTPGNSNFVPDAMVLIPSIGGAIIAVDGLEGVKYQTELIMQKIKDNKVPCFAFISRLDKEHTDFDKALQSVEDSFPIEPLTVQIPIGKEAEFSGVVDLLSNKAFTYADDTGKGKETDIPDDLKDKAEEMRSNMIERLVEADDEVMMKYLDGEEISDEELTACLKKGVAENTFCPVFCGAPLKNIGIDLLFDRVISTFPCPAEERARFVTDSDGADETELKISEDGNFAAQVIKTLSDPFAGKVSILRIFRGSMTPDENFYNMDKQSKERPGKFFFQRGKTQEQIEKAVAGDIVSILKLKDAGTGDTLLSAENDNIKFPALPTIPPMVNLTVHPKSTGEEEKMAQAIHRILEEDINLTFWRDDQTNEFIFSGIGQSQVDVAKERMLRKFGVEVELGTPKIPYRETIKGKAEVQGKYKKQTGGKGQFGDCHIRVEPNPNQGFEFINSIVGGVIPRQFIPAVEKGIVGAMEKGELSGNPVQDVKVELFFGSFHAVDSSEMAFKIAGSMAWKKAMMDAKPMLLEPIMKVSISVPSEFMGDVYGNISSRRGKVLGSDEDAKLTIIHAEIPQAETFTLSQDLKALTGDRATFINVFDHYEEAPSVVADKVIAEYKKEREEG